MTPFEAFRLQLRLEGFKIVDGDHLRQVEAVPGEEMPLMILAQMADGQVAACFDEFLDRELYLELIGQVHHIQFPAIDPLIDVLVAKNIAFDVGHYKTNLFPGTFLDFISGDVECRSEDDPLVRNFGFGDFGRPVYVIEQDGRIVSACVSSRENERCGEAWVCTDPQYRRLGLARQVVSAWAKDLLSAGKVPFYSHKIENIASANLAERLGLKAIFEEISISYMNV